MLTSIPSFPPHDSHTLWYHSSHRYPIRDPPTSAQTNNTTQPPTTPTNPEAPTRPHARRHNNPPPHRSATLTNLSADELLLASRKLNIQRFGATWLRPPGVSKTYQAAVDEALERMEQEAIARREESLREQQVAAEQAAAAAAEMGVDVLGMGMPIGEGEVMERDLDAGVPEGEGGGLGVDAGEDERDLDDDVPEAGEYEHTDTEDEDDELDDEDDGVIGDEDAPGSVVIQEIGGGLRLRTSLASTADGESSMLVSSPIPPNRRRQARRSARSRQSLQNSAHRARGG